MARTAKLKDGIRRYGIWRSLSGGLLALKDACSRSDTLRIRTRSDGLLLELDRRRQSMPMLSLFRELTEPEFELLRRILREDSVFLDVGGGIGAYSVFASRFTRRPIHLFEPVDDNIRAIQRNLKLNAVSSAVRIHRMALSSQTGYGVMQSGRHLFTSRLNEMTSPDEPGAVPVTTLDAFCTEHDLSRIDVLKIDAEGHEMDVLRGAEQMLAGGKISLLILEINGSALDVGLLLGGSGYRPFHYDPFRNVLRELASLDWDQILRAKPSALNTNFVFLHAAGADETLQRVNGMAGA